MTDATEEGHGPARSPPTGIVEADQPLAIRPVQRQRALRSVTIVGGLLVCAAVAPAHAALTSNPLTSNPLTSNPLTSNSLTANSLTANSLTANSLASTLQNLNGVAVVAVTLPTAVAR